MDASQLRVGTSEPPPPHYQNVDWLVFVQTTTIAIEFLTAEVLS